MTLIDRVDVSNLYPWALHRAGYDFSDIATAARPNWHLIPSWGSRGWDLGHWPLQAIFISTDPIAPFRVVEYTEGDAVSYHYPTAAERNAHIDRYALEIWRRMDAPWLNRNPEELRGPYHHLATVTP